MTRIDDVHGDELKEVLRRLRKLETASPLVATSITRGRLRIGGTAVLLVDSSGGVVIEGTLNGDGTITWSGVTTLTGTTNLNGPTTVNGNTSIAGTLDVSGITTLLNNLIVGSGGKISLGGLSLEPTGSGAGTINFLPTGSISASADGSITIVSPDLTTIVTIGDSQMTVNGRVI